MGYGVEDQFERVPIGQPSNIEPVHVKFLVYSSTFTGEGDIACIPTNVYPDDQLTMVEIAERAAMMLGIRYGSKCRPTLIPLSDIAFLSPPRADERVWDSLPVIHDIRGHFQLGSDGTSIKECLEKHGMPAPKPSAKAVPFSARYWDYNYACEIPRCVGSWHRVYAPYDQVNCIWFEVHKPYEKVTRAVIQASLSECLGNVADRAARVLGLSLSHGMDFALTLPVYNKRSETVTDVMGREPYREQLVSTLVRLECSSRIVAVLAVLPHNRRIPKQPPNALIEVLNGHECVVSVWDTSGKACIKVRVNEITRTMTSIAYEAARELALDPPYKTMRWCLTQEVDCSHAAVYYGQTLGTVWRHVYMRGSQIRLVAMYPKHIVGYYRTGEFIVRINPDEIIATDPPTPP